MIKGNIFIPMNCSLFQSGRYNEYIEKKASTIFFFFRSFHNQFVKVEGSYLCTGWFWKRSLLVYFVLFCFICFILFYGPIKICFPYVFPSTSVTLSKVRVFLNYSISIFFLRLFSFLRLLDILFSIFTWCNIFHVDFESTSPKLLGDLMKFVCLWFLSRILA